MNQSGHLHAAKELDIQVSHLRHPQTAERVVETKINDTP